MDLRGNSKVYDGTDALRIYKEISWEIVWSSEKC